MWDAAHRAIADGARPSGRVAADPRSYVVHDPSGERPPAFHLPVVTPAEDVAEHEREVRRAMMRRFTL